MFDPNQIEKKWIQKWADGYVSYTADPQSTKDKKYILVEFPFPSGAGLHVGHTKSYMALDIRARKYRMEGYDVMYPMGWDAFGLPTELYALKNGVHPREATATNIARFKEQMARLGVSFDWSREVNTTDPNYFKWTQWIWLQMFKEGLAYQDSTQVWWCEELKTVLANEEVIDGKSERGGHSCERRPLTQWMLAITKYADRLDADLDEVDYLDVIKTQQRNWIGKSTGARVTFGVKDSPETFDIYTTRPDTLMGVTYMVLAPEHELVSKITTSEQQAKVVEYIEQTKKKSDLDRQQQKEKSGVFTGAYAVHPLTGESVPVWIADYVLMGYGTGAIMAVPAHDERDMEFAQKFGLEIKPVVDVPGEDIGAKSGTLINSGEFDGLSVSEGAKAIIQKLSEVGVGREETQFKLRDWVFSRQRYWGEPFPIVWIAEDSYPQIGDISEYCPQQPVTRERDGKTEYAVALHPEELPLTLPEVETLEPQGLGEGPLAQAIDWINVWYDLETGRTKPQTEQKPGDTWVKAQRETDTMPNWAGSSWYFLRYVDPNNDQALADPAKLTDWMPVDLYNGGMEHVTLHLLYSRFWHKFLYDIGVVPTKEPYKRRIFHGMILAEGGVKMSKSKGNTIDPLEMCDSFGADSLRCYIMFMGPYDEAIAWDTNGLVGCNRFLTKAYHWVHDLEQGGAVTKEADLDRDLHSLIKKMSQDIEAQKFNTCVSSMMEFVNTWQGTNIGLDRMKTFVTLLAPFAPHLTEELWEVLGGTTSVHQESWPTYNESKLETTEVDYQVHVNGKMRAMITVGKDASEDEIKTLSLEQDTVTQHTDGLQIVKHMVISAKNIVIIIAK